MTSVWSPEYVVKQIADLVRHLLEPFGVRVSSSGFTISMAASQPLEVPIVYEFRVNEPDVERHGHEDAWCRWQAGIIAEQFCREVIRRQYGSYEQEKADVPCVVPRQTP